MAWLGVCLISYIVCEPGMGESFEDEPETRMVKEEVMDPLTETNLWLEWNTRTCLWSHDLQTFWLKRK